MLVSDKKTEEIIKENYLKFFDFYFPWYSEEGEGLKEFEILFLTKFYMRQIGCETMALFKLYLQGKLIEKMPFYKQLYDSTKIKYDPLINRKITTNEDETNESERGKESSNVVSTNANGNTTTDSEENRTANGNSDTTGNRTNEINSQAVHSENPEITMANNDYASNMDRERKTDNEDTTQHIEGESNENVTGNQSTNSKAESTETGNSKENEKENKSKNFTQSIEGFYGESQSDMILKYRETILNINEMICNDLEPFFLGYYGGDYNLLCW